MPKAESATKPEISFEAALTQLEKIVEEMDDDALPLEELIVRYSEGTKLVKVCEERLATVEKKIEIISRSATGEPRLQDFEPAAAAAAESTPPPAKSRASKDDVSLF
jgi:exodeoxyribonuclease VII small subunit